MHLVFTANQKGGSRKTATMALIADAIASRGIPFRICETDGQGHLKARFPGLVQTITLPTTDEILTDDSAEPGAVAPIDDMLRDPEGPEFVLVDLGANLVARMAETLVTSTIAEYLASRADIQVTIVVPVQLDAESISMGATAKELLLTAIPSATTVVAICAEPQMYFDLLHKNANADFKKHFGALVHEGRCMNIPTIGVTALSALEGASLSPLSFSALTDEELLRLFPGRRPTVARYARGKIIEYHERADREVSAAFGFR